jgi:hypothetical protein
MPWRCGIVAIAGNLDPLSSVLILRIYPVGRNLNYNWLAIGAIGLPMDNSQVRASFAILAKLHPQSDCTVVCIARFKPRLKNESSE